jgi:hypothetical protein
LLTLDAVASVYKAVMIASLFGPLGLAILSAVPALAKDWEGQAYTWLYQFPMPIPPVKTPAM